MDKIREKIATMRDNAAYFYTNQELANSTIDILADLTDAMADLAAAVEANTPAATAAPAAKTSKR